MPGHSHSAIAERLAFGTSPSKFEKKITRYMLYYRIYRVIFFSNLDGEYLWFGSGTLT